MIYPLLCCYAFFCVVIGAALGFYNESVWLILAFIVANIFCIQIGFFLALMLRS
jgi:hypothetical protein